MDRRRMDRQSITRNRHTMPDFTFLDRVAWIKILSYLDQNDRLAVAKTCTTLQEYCLSEGCLWRSLEMHVGWNEVSKRNKPRKLRLAETEREVLQISRGKIQDVKFILYNCYNQDFDEKSFQCLNDASKTWPLKSFAFHVRHSCRACVRSSLGSCSNRRISLSCKQFLIDCLTSENARRLKSLGADTLSSFDAHGTLTLFEILKDSPFSHSLEILALDINIRGESYIPSLTNDYMSALCSTVGRFINLQDLMIPFVSLSDQLLETLAQPGRAKLRIIVLICGTLPEKLSSWPKLLASSPSLNVAVFSEKAFSSDSMLAVLPPCVPVVAWYVSTGDLSYNARLERQKQLFQLLPLYAQHLTHLFSSDHKESLRSSDEDLLLLVTKCTKLTSIKFAGQVSSDMILKIATLGRKWKVLIFFDRAICFSQAWAGNREEKMARLCSEVSKSLGYSWKPVSTMKAQNLSSQVTEYKGVEVEVKTKNVYL